MLLPPGFAYKNSLLHISDPINDLPWTTIGNCLPGIWKSKKTNVGLRVCHEDYLDDDESHKGWIYSGRDVGIDSECLLVCYDYDTRKFNKLTHETVVEDKWTDDEFSAIKVDNDYYDIYVKLNSRNEVIGVWVRDFFMKDE